MIIKKYAYPRVGLIGNPSDGYFGKTIAFTFSNFSAEVMLYTTPELEILPAGRDHSRFDSLQELISDVAQYGYYGGVRLLKATIKRFSSYCADHGIRLHRNNFTIRYRSNIPHQVGLAGSSAIITACLRALMSFFDVEIPLPVQANLVLAVETDELQIPAGLQDRVAQVYEGLVYMDFAREYFDRQGCGEYVRLDPALLPPLYVAYRTDLAEGTEVFHNDIRSRYDRGEKKVVSAMAYWATLTVKARTLLESGRPSGLGALLDANFDRRAAIYEIGAENLRMVEAARSAGASAKFTGSGGAIVGTYGSEKVFTSLKKRLGALGVKVLKPRVKA
jgi:glucuronokinase